MQRIQAPRLPTAKMKGQGLLPMQVQSMLMVELLQFR